MDLPPLLGMKQMDLLAQGTTLVLKSGTDSADRRRLEREARVTGTDEPEEKVPEEKVLEAVD